MRRLENKVALIAGGGAIGSETARRLALEGCRVAIGDIDGDHALAVAEEIRRTGGEAEGFAYDQADEQSVAALVSSVVERFGRLDCLHCNAAEMDAIMRDEDVLDLDMAVFDRTVDVNMRGYVLLARSALPHLLASRGAIVFTSSGAAYIGEPIRVAYAMTKAGILALMRHIASRWGKDGLRSNAIAPGFVVTERMKNTLTPEFSDQVLQATRSPRHGTPADIAAMVAMLFSDDGNWINGQVLSVDGGTTMR